MSPKTGRPPKSEDGTKGLRLEIRITKAELDKIQACADKLSLSKSETILKGIDILFEHLED